MSNPAIGLAETIQTASLKRHPSPAHDINPSTSASKKQPISSDAASISSSAVDPGRTIRPLSRRSQLPPLPDLRFEQSYLNSLNGAESWGRIAWITIRDQVNLFLYSHGSFFALLMNHKTGLPSIDTRNPLVSCPFWMAILEPRSSV